MKKKKILGGLVVLTVAVSLASCGKKYEDPYAVELNKPMLLADGNANDERFSWTPVVGADGYLIKVDDGEAVGIGNPIVTSAESEGFTTCYYVLNTDSLTEGEHTVQFAAYAKDKVSEWTDVFSIVVRKKITMNLAAPTLQSDLQVNFSRDANVEKVEYDFGNGIVASIPCGENTSYVITTPEILGIADKLVYNQVYIVTARTYRNGEYSEKSNPTAYTFNNAKFNALKKPVIANGIIVFEEQVDRPVLTIKVNNSEYILRMSGSFTSMNVGDLLNALIEAKLMEISEVATGNYTVAVKVNFDSSHYIESEYSNTYAVTNEIDDESIAEMIFESFVFSKLSATEFDCYLNIPSEAINDYVTISASSNDAKLDLIAYEKNDITHYSAICAKNTTEVKFTVTYKRGDYTESKDFEYKADLSAVIQYVYVGSNTLYWNVRGKTADLDGYIVEVTRGGTVTQFPVTSASFNLSELKGYEGNLSFQVFTSYNGEKVESSASPSLSLEKKYDPYSIWFENGEYTVLKGQKVTLIKNNARDYYEGETIYLTQIDNDTKINVVNLGDGIHTINSDALEITLIQKGANDLDYEIIENRYLLLKEDSSILNSFPSKFIVKKDNKNMFDVVAFNESTVSSIQFGSKSFSLHSGENEIIYGTLYKYSFEFAPSVYIESSDGAYIQWSPSSLFDGQYEVIVESVDREDEIPVYTEVQNKGGEMSQTSIYLGDLVPGEYRVTIRTIGNGIVLNGFGRVLTYVVPEPEAEAE